MRPDNLDEPVKMVERPRGSNVWVEPENVLTSAQREELDQLARDGDDCRVAIWHGPGHQSHTECQVEGDHDRHVAVYGALSQEASWTGTRDVFSGNLGYDDPPSEESPSYVRDDWTLRHRRRMADFRARR